MIIATATFQVIIGVLLLAFAGNQFINASASLARHFKLSPLMIGIVLVGFGTSFPELIVSAVAAVRGSAPIAIGNVIGSNIANIGLVLAIATLLLPIKVDSRLIKREFPILILVSLFLGVLLWNRYLSTMEGVLLLIVLSLHLTWISYHLPKQQKDPLVKEAAHEMPKLMSLQKSVIWWIVGLLLLFLGSELLVSGAVKVAQLMGVSDLVIGLTIVTIGTSLPEFVATIVSVFKKEHDIAIGHIVGSNIFNSLAVLAMPALIAPGLFPASVAVRDYPVMLGFTIGLWLFTFLVPPKRQLGRLFGCIFLSAYILYFVLLLYG